MPSHRNSSLHCSIHKLTIQTANVHLTTAEGDLVLTSEDGRVARFAAAEIAGRTRRSIRVLAGGTAAWKAAGVPLDTGMGALANEPDDVALSARERSADRERYMREYLAWEIDLVNQIARDTDCRFRLAPA